VDPSHGYNYTVQRAKPRLKVTMHVTPGRTQPRPGIRIRSLCSTHRNNVRTALHKQLHIALQMIESGHIVVAEGEAEQISVGALMRR